MSEYELKNPTKAEIQAIVDTVVDLHCRLNDAMEWNEEYRKQIAALEKDCDELEEYKYMYEDLCK